ncbi:MAG: hypothetical protein FWD60_10920 [Candidatus Azobacteroides sp.]|nr:hypothetical protein [Candidatus Azobacteroides sp.]
MKTLLLATMILCTALSQLSAQIKINDVNCYNLGDGRYYCQNKETKEPLEGSVRMIDGYTSQYVEAVFKKGIPDGSWKRYENNVLVEEYTYKEGILNGDYKTYYTDGSKKSERQFVNGKAEGKFIKYYTNGKIESEVNFKNGEQDGAEVFYDSEGNVRSSATYSTGKENGTKKQSYGDYELSANYKDGKYDGAYSEIFTNGNTKVKGNYIDGKKDGTWEFGKKDGSKIRTEVYANDDKIKETIYYTDGSVEVVRELKNGKKNGWERTYNFREGTLKSEIYYRDGEVSSNTADGNGASGKNSGLAKQTKQITSNYGIYIQTFYQNNGKYEGEYTEQWAEGDKAMKTKGQYENGKKTGLWIYYNQYGQKEREETFADDKLDGKQTFYDRSEKVSKYYNYKNDVKDGEYAVYSNAVLSEKGTYVNDRVEGLRTYYYPNGKSQRETLLPHNPNGERVEKEYSEKGILLTEFRYEGGQQVSEKHYFDNGKLKQALQLDENGRLKVVEEYDESGKKIK